MCKWQRRATLTRVERIPLYSRHPTLMPTLSNATHGLAIDTRRETDKWRGHYESCISPSRTDVRMQLIRS
jgi:hypothetical protein